MKRPEPLDLDTVAWVIEIGQEERRGSAQLLQAVCDGGLRRGLSIHRVHVSFIPQHPQLRVGILQWSPGRAVSWGHTSWPDKQLRSPAYRRNPLYLLREGHVDEVRTRLSDRNRAERFRITHELAREGLTDYFALAIDSGLEIPNTISFATHDDEGFSDETIVTLRSIAWALQSVFQRETWRTLSETLSTTYIGTNAGRRVLAGTIRRGQMSRETAVVWFCDMRDYSRLLQELADEEVFAALDSFFDAVGSAVESNGGEVLKFIGDAVFAVFPYVTDEEAVQACNAAFKGAVSCLEALDHVNRSRLAAGQPNLRCGIGLHRGTIVYGNVGTQTRLDFTAMGQVVNLASRVESLCSRLGQPLLMSESVAELVHDDLESRGLHEVKGSAEKVHVFGLPQTRVFEASQAPLQVPPPSLEISE